MTDKQAALVDALLAERDDPRNRVESTDFYSGMTRAIVVVRRELQKREQRGDLIPLQAQLDAANARIKQLERQRMYWFEYATSRAIDDVPKRDDSAGGVQGRVDGIIQDALDGRLTPSQKSGIRTSIDRSDRITPSSDKAVGKAIGG